MIGWKPKFKDLQVASVRYRCLNPLRELQRRGFPIELFDELNVGRYSCVVFSKLYDERNPKPDVRVAVSKQKCINDAKRILFPKPST